MATLTESQIVEAARKTREIDERPSAKLEPYYLEAFRKHAAEHPNDLNFIVELASVKKPSAGGNGFGVATCLDDFCWVDVRLGADPNLADGGKTNGFGSLWEYQIHCETPDHVRGRTQRCSNTGVTYQPAGLNRAPVAAAAQAQAAQPAPSPSAAAGPSRTASSSSSASRPAASASSSQAGSSKPAPMDRKVGLGGSSSSSLLRGSSSNALQPTSRHNLPASSPLSRTESKPFLGGSQGKSVLSLLDADDEVEVLQPDEIPVEYRKKPTNRDNPFSLSDDEDAADPFSSSARPQGSSVGGHMPSSPAANALDRLTKNRTVIQPKVEQGLAVNRPPTPKTAEAIRLEQLRNAVDTFRAARNQAFARLYGDVCSLWQPGAVSSTPLQADIRLFTAALKGMNGAAETTPYPATPLSIASAYPAIANQNTICRNYYKRLSEASQAYRLALAAAGPQQSQPAIGSSPIPAHAALVSTAALGSTSAVGAATSVVTLPGGQTVAVPAHLAGDELDDYVADRYGEQNRPNGSLQEFFQDSLASFSDDQDVDKALQTLGLANMDAKLPDLLVTLMPHQILGVAFMLDKEKDRRYQGGLLCDAMGLGKTVQTIAIIVKNKSVDPRVKTTLIVAPLAVLNQWKSEIESKTTEGLLKVGIHHGVSKYKLAKEFKQFDIVLTTYGTLISDFAEPKTKKKKKRLYPLPGGAHDSDEEDDAPPPPARKKGPCFRFRFFRIVLDESHIIRNKSTQASRAVADLDAIYRWSLSGTIVNNSLDDVFPHLRFLSISPQSEWSEFKKHITDRVKKAPRLAANRTQAILKTCMIRRHKESELNGQRLLNLPPKETTHVELDFGPEERAIYDQVEHRMKIKFGNFLKQGTVLKNMSCVLTMLMRLRQLTCHPWLLRRNPGDPAHPEDFVVSDEDLTLSLNVPVVNAGEDFLKAATTLGPEWISSVSNKLRERYESIQKGDQQADDGGHTDDDCAICFEPFATETLTECKHSFCFTCITGWFTNPPTAGGDLTDEQAARGARKCPFCREVIESTKLYAAAAFFQPEVDKDPEAGMDEGSSVVRAGKRKSLGEADEDDEFLAARPKSKKDKKGKGKERAVEEEEMDEITNVLPSTKMKVMGDLLDEYLAEDGIKVIIFSEFVTYLKLVEVFLDNKGIKNRIYHGGMRQSDRLDVIREFTGEVKDENSPRVMLISRKAGGAGLNLTAASKVISLDLAWNAASENQATDRAHRIGQTRPVDIRRLIINGTVEQSILALQEKKSALADGAMGEGAGGRLGRLTVQDLMRLFDYNAADD